MGVVCCNKTGINTIALPVAARRFLLAHELLFRLLSSEFKKSHRHAESQTVKEEKDFRL